MMLTIAHDLRAPLATIKGCAELLPGEEKKSRKDEYAENILHSSDYMIGLVNTLIGFYLLDTGRNKPDFPAGDPFQRNSPDLRFAGQKEKAAADNRLFRSGCGSKR